MFWSVRLLVHLLRGATEALAGMEPDDDDVDAYKMKTRKIIKEVLCSLYYRAFPLPPSLPPVPSLSKTPGKNPADDHAPSTDAGGGTVIEAHLRYPSTSRQRRPASESGDGDGPSGL